jgi:hypothetical protein
MQRGTDCLEGLMLRFIHSSMALQPFLGTSYLLQFHNLFTQTIGLFGRGISPSQGLCLHAGQHKHRINAYTDFHALSGIRTHDPSVRASEDSPRLRPRDHYDRMLRLKLILKQGEILWPRFIWLGISGSNTSKEVLVQQSDY